MKRHSLYFAAPHRVELREEVWPQPRRGQVLVQTLYSAISPGTEMLLYRGQMAHGLAADETIAALSGPLAYPLKYGYAAVGRVVALGEDVGESWRERLVFAFHPHESHFLATPEILHPLPQEIGPELATLLPNMETAVSLVMDGQPVIGEQVAIFGQGIVGLLTALLLAQTPLARLVTLDHYPLRRDWSLRLGAGQALDAARASVGEIRAALRQEGEYEGADLLYELSGNPAALDLAIQCAGYNGRLVIGSWYGQREVMLDLGGRFHRSQMRLIASQVSRLAPQWTGRWTKARRLAIAWRMLAQHRPEALITHRFPFEEAAAAYRLLHERPHEAIGVLLHYE